MSVSGTEISISETRSAASETDSVSVSSITSHYSKPKEKPKFHIYVIGDKKTTVDISSEILAHVSVVPLPMSEIIGFLPPVDPKIIPLKTKKIIPIVPKNLTLGVETHLRNLKGLAQVDFNWGYYCQKYPDLTSLKTSQLAWGHWKNNGLKEFRNPLNNRTLFKTLEINQVLLWMSLILDAQVRECDYLIFIPDPRYCKSVVRLLHKPMRQSICHVGHLGWRIHVSVFDSLFYELSFLIHSFDVLISMWRLTYPDKIKSLDPAISVSERRGHTVKSVMEINLVNIYDHISVVEFRYVSFEYRKFIKDHNLSELDLLILNQQLCKFPYSQVKLDFNHECNLDLPHYLMLCHRLGPHYDLSPLKVRDIATPIHHLDFQTLWFNHDYYLQLYPCHQKVFKTYVISYDHYQTRGTIEKLLPNQLCFNLVKIRQDLTCYQKLQILNSGPIKIPAPMSQTQRPLIYILTRTCDRPTLFSDCCQSVREQFYVNARHIVSYDDEKTRLYVNLTTGLYSTLNLITKKGVLHPNQYIDNLYELIPSDEPGWVMVLDDDDKFLTPTALYFLEPYLTDPNRVIIWKFYRPDKYIYPSIPDNLVKVPSDPKQPNVPFLPELGEIASCAYFYHSSKIVKGQWGRNGVGDYQFFKYLLSNTKEHIYLDYPLTGVNYRTQISGWSAM